MMMCHHMPSGVPKGTLNRCIFDGLQRLFNKQTKHRISLPKKDEKWTMKSLINWLRHNLLTDKPELFVQGETVCSGILVLVNDSDWELLGELEYEIQPEDTISFIKSIHAG